VTGRRGRICKQLLDDLKDRKRYWKLMEECFGRYYGRLMGRQTRGWRVTEGDLEELTECKNSNV